jgi:hypothetical protein
MLGAGSSHAQTIAFMEEPTGSPLSPWRLNVTSREPVSLSNCVPCDSKLLGCSELAATWDQNGRNVRASWPATFNAILMP